MNQRIFESLLVCPKCRNRLEIKGHRGKCRLCQKSYPKTDGIWRFLYQTSGESIGSRKQYDKLFDDHFQGPRDGSYQILASFTKGNRSLDIACGAGLIEKLSPHTVGLDFSLSALKIAQKNGAEFLIQADAHHLPFKNGAFQMAVSAGSLEHFANPQMAVREMARISRIQVFLVHKFPPLPFISYFFHKLCHLLNIKLQPIENPLTKYQLKQILKKANLHTVFSGVWTLPVNYGRSVRFLPEFTNLPSSYFIVSIKNPLT